MKILAVALAVGVIIVGAFMFISNEKGMAEQQITSIISNVGVVDGKQIIDISAKGGYTPRRTVAKAGVPAVIRVTTRNTFDCSSALSIPDLSVQAHLAPSGIKELSVPPQEPGAKIQGVCSMGMYSFTIFFN